METGEAGLPRRLGVYGVGELTGHIKGLLEADAILQDIWVEGEIINFTKAASGHVYFTLKDETSQIGCVLWRSFAQRAGRLPQEGEAALVHGRVSVYELRGAYQLYADLVAPLGLGFLHLQFEEIKERLEAEGLFAPERKRSLPPFPRVLGVATSPVGAALQDILEILRRRYPLVEVLVASTPVQGEEAPPQIVAALELLNDHPQVEAIILARGGGSPEELWAFNDERVARAIFCSRVPVITGIGHHIDLTIADLVADVHAPTPSAAAEMAVPDGMELAKMARSLQGRVLNQAQTHLRLAQGNLDWQRRLLTRLSPQAVADRGRQRLDEIAESLQGRLLQHLALRQAQVLGLEGHLKALDPLGVLQRGFAMVQERGTLRVVRSVCQALPSTPLTVRVSDGSFPAKVEEN